MTAVLHFRQTVELLGLILDGKLPADTQTERYFRAHRKMGVRDRAAVAEGVYHCLRHKRLLGHCAAVEVPAPADLVAAYLVTKGLSARVLEQAGYRGDADGLAACVRNLDAAALPFAVRASLPDWLAERLENQFGETEAWALALALNQPAPVDLRVNTLKLKREQVRTKLAQEGFRTEPTPYSPFGLRHADRAPVTGTHCFKEGLFEVQDEGSQLVSVLLEPRRHEIVVDFCAGAGGKTLHLATLLANTGTVYAFDVSAQRLERLKPRLNRAGLDNVRMVAIPHERDARVHRLDGKVDRVLVDTPCSGTGTLRRNPDIKWQAIDLAGCIEGQKRILAAAARLTKRAGRLVYATCSLLREENEEIVDDFLAVHPDFRVVPASEILVRRHIALATTDEALRLLPHRHGTDGFFAIALERR